MCKGVNKNIIYTFLDIYKNRDKQKKMKYFFNMINKLLNNQVGN
jgi:hypothetical protein